MAELTIDSNVDNIYQLHAHRWVATTAIGTIYVIFEDSDRDIKFYKSVDNGASFAGPTVIHSGTVIDWDIWHDRWTEDDPGDLIHIAINDTGSDDTLYYNLDPSDDSITGPVTVNAGVSYAGANDSFFQHYLGIAKAIGGNIGVAYYGDENGENGFSVSTDGGLSFASRTTMADGNPVDQFILLPGYESDNQDFLLIYWDVSANELTIKTYDDDGDSWSESVISGGFVETIFNGLGFAAGPDQASNGVYLAAWTELDQPTSDLKFYTITGTVGAYTITERNDVLTNTPEAYNTAIFIDQQNDEVYVFYVLADTVITTDDQIYYQKTSDKGVTWGVAVPISTTADDFRSLTVPLSIGDEGGTLLTVWVNRDLFDLLTDPDKGFDIPVAPEPPTPPSDPFPEYGQIRTAIGDPSVFGAPILRS